MGNPFCHIELSTTDLVGAKGFYTKLFDWKAEGAPQMPYAMINTGSKEVGGGIQPLPMPGAPTAWLPYVTVPSVKVALTKAAKLGGKVVLPYHPIPPNGAIGVFLDPQGAALGVWEAAKKVAQKPAAKKPAKKSKR